MTKRQIKKQLKKLDKIYWKLDSLSFHIIYSLGMLFLSVGGALAISVVLFPYLKNYIWHISLIILTILNVDNFISKSKKFSKNVLIINAIILILVIITKFCLKI